MRRRESSLRDRVMTLIVCAESRRMGRRTRSRFSGASSMTCKAKRRSLARTKSKRKASRERRWDLVDHGSSDPDPFLFCPYRTPLHHFRPDLKI
jgi:hypothetical protein